jgi:hypothetical protein
VFGRWSPTPLILGLVLCVACSAPALVPAPTALPQPTVEPTLAPGQPTPQPTEAVSDVENAFLSNVDDVISEAADLAVTPCPDLVSATTDDPNLIASLHGFADALKRVSASPAELNTDQVHASLADLDHTLGQLDGALSQCGIKQP